MDSETVIPEADTNQAEDALQALKLDPAVLDAKITVNSDEERDVDTPELEILEHIEDTPEITENKPNEKKYKEGMESAQFEEMIRMQKAALLSLAPDQFGMLLQYAYLLRKKRLLSQKHLECAFCKNNGEPASWYISHKLKDSRGRVLCPVLRGYRCPNCGASGDRAHTLKYCPEYYKTGLWSR